MLTIRRWAMRNAGLVVREVVAQSRVLGGRRALFSEVAPHA
jgi:hypothetical protein